jgi:hypothetical protein
VTCIFYQKVDSCWWKVARFGGSPCFREPNHQQQRRLPRGFCYAGNFAVERHFAELHAANPELAHVAFGAARQHTAVVQADGVGVAREFVERIVVACLFEFLAEFGIFCDMRSRLRPRAITDFFAILLSI